MAGRADTYLQLHARVDARTAPVEALDIDMVAVEASLGLHDRQPELSSLTVCRRQAARPGLASRAAAVAGPLAIAFPGPALLALSAALFAAFSLVIAWRALLVLVACLPSRPRKPRGDAAVAPVYSILVPLYKEAAAVPGLAEAMLNLEWPQDRMDLILLLEADDTETQAAVAGARWPQATRIFILPDGRPRTKPRALNYGLQFARGSLLTIYDAEDRPAPGQLTAAAAAFRTGDPALACVQAPLVAYNHREGWLAGQWALEYRVQFGLLMPALARMGLPLLLGGTSNHFRTDVLRSLNGWDAWNVTEDADLGVRLARHGYRAGMIAPPTLEEAPEKLGIWTAQRSRWLKGFLQSWVVMMRRPERAVRQIGLAGAVSLQLGLAGTLLAALAHLPVLIACLCLAFLAGWQSLGVPGFALLVAGLGVNAAAALLAPGPRDRSRLMLTLTQPLYWPLQTLAAIRAVYSMARAPHFWAKTPHGLTASPV